MSHGEYPIEHKREQAALDMARVIIAAHYETTTPMTLPTIHDICTKSCSFSTYMLSLCGKLQAEGNRAPTEREATELIEQFRAVAAVMPKSGETDIIVTYPNSTTQL